MTLVVLTGLLIAHVVAIFAGHEVGWSAGLWYIAIHAISSYFMSGWVKLINKQWRNGQALNIFFILREQKAAHLLLLSKPTHTFMIKKEAGD